MPENQHDTDSDFTATLQDGRVLHITGSSFPISLQEQMTLIELWQTEWDHTGFDWLPWMRGAHADTFMTYVVVGLLEGRAVATATVGYAVTDPELCVIMNVVTRRECRGLGIGGRLTDAVVQKAFRAGCRIAYLGNKPSPKSVYERIGFRRITGVFMRRAAPESENYEAQLFAPHQHTAVRTAVWGDIPGTACLVAQPLNSLLINYQFGLVSSKYLPAERGLTQFSVLWYGTQSQHGAFLVLAGDRAHRVLGLGALTPHPGASRRHTAAIDFVAHDNYESEAGAILEALIDDAVSRQIRTLSAYTSRDDESKAECLEEKRFRHVASQTHALSIQDKWMDVRVWERSI